MATLGHRLRTLLNRSGWDFHRHRPYPADVTREQIELWELVRPHTQTDIERVVALADAVEYVLDADVPGALVECGVGPGGSMMAVAQTLVRRGVSDRDLVLFDTFTGMTEPTVADVEVMGDSAIEGIKRPYRRSDHPLHVHPDLERVRANMTLTGYPAERIHYVVGAIEETLPDGAPDEVALLRLDTDWYETTRVEMEHLYPRLSPGGVLIVDDYRHWNHQRRAVDEYFAEHGRPFLARIGHGSCFAVKR